MQSKAKTHTRGVNRKRVAANRAGSFVFSFSCLISASGLSPANSDTRATLPIRWRAHENEVGAGNTRACRNATGSVERSFSYSSSSTKTNGTFLRRWNGARLSEKMRLRVVTAFFFFIRESRRKCFAPTARFGASVAHYSPCPSRSKENEITDRCDGQAAGIDGTFSSPSGCRSLQFRGERIPSEKFTVGSATKVSARGKRFSFSRYKR